MSKIQKAKFTAPLNFKDDLRNLDVCLSSVFEHP